MVSIQQSSQSGPLLLVRGSSFPTTTRGVWGNNPSENKTSRLFHTHATPSLTLATPLATPPSYHARSSLVPGCPSAPQHLVERWIASIPVPAAAEANVPRHPTVKPAHWPPWRQLSNRPTWRPCGNTRSLEPSPPRGRLLSPAGCSLSHFPIDGCSWLGADAAASFFRHSSQRPLPVRRGSQTRRVSDD